MIKNSYKRTDRREAFDLAVKLAFGHSDMMQDEHILLISKIAKELNPSVGSREMRRVIAAKAVRLVKKELQNNIGKK